MQAWPCSPPWIARKLAREVLALGKAAGICAIADANAAAPDAARRRTSSFPTCEGNADTPALIEFQDVSVHLRRGRGRNGNASASRPLPPARRNGATAPIACGPCATSRFTGAPRRVPRRCRAHRQRQIDAHPAHERHLAPHARGACSSTGADIAGEGRRQPRCAAAMGVVFQYPEHQLFAETVYRGRRLRAAQPGAFGRGG